MGGKNPEVYYHRPIGYYGGLEQRSGVTQHERLKQNIFVEWFRSRAGSISTALLAVAIIGLAGIALRNSWYDSQEREIVASFAQQVRDKLDGKAPYQLGEVFYPTIVLVPALEVSDKTYEMQPTKGPINVRQVPFTQYPGIGGDTKIIGTAAQGSRVKNALLTTGIAPHGALPGNWITALCIDFEGLVANPGNQGIKNDPTAVCTVTELYAKATAPKIGPKEQPTVTLSEQTPQDKTAQGK